MKKAKHETGSLYIALDLGSTKWAIAASSETASKARHRTIAAGDLSALRTEAMAAKARFGLDAQAPVRSCYEAGRDGFWLHRELERWGYDNVVIDPGSLAAPRKRRAKTDRIDAGTMLEALLRHHRGERSMSVVRVPSMEVEDQRRMERERERLTKERTSLRSQISSMLATCGVAPMNRPPRNAASVVDRLGQPLGEGACKQLTRQLERLDLVERQLTAIGSERATELAEGTRQVAVVASRLALLKGIGELSAFALSLEGLGWRDFQNTKQVSASTGLVAVPHMSDQGSRDLGISKAARPKLRSLLVQLAWLWLRYQPQSALSQWFQERFATAGKRARRRGIVAVARKLYVALWKYIRFGQVPEGAIFSP